MNLTKQTGCFSCKSRLRLSKWTKGVVADVSRSGSSRKTKRQRQILVTCFSNEGLNAALEEREEGTCSGILHSDVSRAFPQGYCRRGRIVLLKIYSRVKPFGVSRKVEKDESSNPNPTLVEPVQKLRLMYQPGDENRPDGRNPSKT